MQGSKLRKDKGKVKDKAREGKFRKTAPIQKKKGPAEKEKVKKAVYQHIENKILEAAKKDGLALGVVKPVDERKVKHVILSKGKSHT